MVIMVILKIFPIVFQKLSMILVILNFSPFSICQEQSFEIPLGGNAFITKHGSKASPEVITNAGLENWTDPNSICSVYFKLSVPETFRVALRVTPRGSSKISVAIDNVNSYKVTILYAPMPYILDVGTFAIGQPGYVKLDIQGVAKIGTHFADVESVILSNIAGKVAYVANPASFYFGLRGPTVHFRFHPNSELPIDYFYGELTVPKGQDIMGSYFVRTGFSNGYFGMQRISKKKRFLFSVWSDFGIDKHDMVEKDRRVRVLRTGKSVTAKVFEYEGSGFQSFRHFNWKPNKTYKFLVQGTPTEDSEGTNYTAWFRPPRSGWQLMATLYKPKVNTYLTQLYSFSESFFKELGYKERKAYFGNEWVRKTDGQWMEMVTAKYTADETSRMGREDLAAGLSTDRKWFFLQNCGFFNEKVEPGVEFTRLPSNKPPKIDLESLP